MNRNTKIMLGVGVGLVVLYMIGKQSQASASTAYAPSIPWKRGGVDANAINDGVDIGAGYHDGITFDNTTGEYVNPFDDGASSYYASDGAPYTAPYSFASTPTSVTQLTSPSPTLDPTLTPTPPMGTAQIAGPRTFSDPGVDYSGVQSVPTSGSQTPAPIQTPVMVTTVPSLTQDTTQQTLPVVPAQQLLSYRPSGVVVSPGSSLHLQPQ